MSETESRRSTAAVAYEALNLSKQNSRDIEAHEDLCAERYDNIHKAIAEIKDTAKADKAEIKKATQDALDEVKKSSTAATDEIKGILKWAGTTVCGIIIALLGFLAAAQFNANDQARRDATAKIELLERQLQQQARPPAVVVQPQT